MTEQRFRKLDAYQLLPDVLAGVKYEDGKPVVTKTVWKAMKRAA